MARSCAIVTSSRVTLQSVSEIAAVQVMVTKIVMTTPAHLTNAVTRTAHFSTVFVSSIVRIPTSLGCRGRTRAMPCIIDNCAVLLKLHWFDLLRICWTFCYRSVKTLSICCVPAYVLYNTDPQQTETVEFEHTPSWMSSTDHYEHGMLVNWLLTSNGSWLVKTNFF